MIFLLLALFVWTGLARAEDVSVSATLSSATTAVGEPVELCLTVQGTQKAAAPQVRVEGLSIQYNGASTQVQMNNFDVSRSIKHTYTVLPQKEGTFTIPALSIDAGGKKLATQSLTLTVSNAPGGGNEGAQEHKFAFSEWVVPKSTAYVGEAVPVELRVYVASQIRWDIHQMPSLSGGGFTVATMPKPAINKVTKDGREYDLVVFKTAVTPVKAGKLILPAMDVNAVMVLPQKRSQRPQLPNGFADMFNDPFFNSAFGQQQQQVTIRPDTVELEIKPLPLEGKPKDFSGAVGRFTLETKAAPLRVRAGDPVTLTAVVKGVGSFDRMNAPAVAEQPGWRIYPPSGKFKADDEVGISGVKTFEIAAIPETAQTELPAVTFSFFNPSTEKYETLAADRGALVVESAPVSTPAPVVASATPSATPAATPAPKPNDIQYIRVDAGSWGGRFDPVWRTRDFWLAQLLALTALLALSGWQWRRVRQSDGAARRAASLRQSKAAVFRVLRQEKTPTEAFYSAAIQAIRLETALGNTHCDPATVDAEAACASRPLDCETAEGIRRVFAAHDELRYAGVGASGGAFAESIHPDQRERVLQILAQFEKSHA
ncbi:MAG: BatD family protein [Verrucomicrobiota bacterium]